MPKRRDTEWRRLWRGVQEFSDDFKPDAVAIGSVAVYLHAIAAERDDLPTEFTHDADFAVGLPAWGDIRDAYEVTPNRRLSKHQIVVHDVEFDLYLERNNKLRLDFADIAPDAVEVRGVRVASLEHLLLLKLDALRDRGGSAHGAKDRRDVAKLLVLLEGKRPRRVAPLVTDEDVRLLERVLRSSAFAEIADDNAHDASVLRRRATVFVTALKRATS